MTTEWVSTLEELGACASAVALARRFQNWTLAWEGSPRGERLLWLADNIRGQRGSASHLKVVLATCACVRLAASGKTDSAAFVAALSASEDWAAGRSTGDTELTVARLAAEAAAVSTGKASRYALMAAANAAALALGWPVDPGIGPWAHAAASCAAAAASATDGPRNADAHAAACALMADEVRRHYQAPPNL